MLSTLFGFPFAAPTGEGWYQRFSKAHI